MAEHPKVFISYSHDSAEHKQWVLELGTKLVQSGVDVVLDRWDLTPGDNFTHFMEAGVRDRDWVLVICTDNYVRRANDREGGVGYEVQIVTAQLVENLGIDKFIPIIRQASGQEKMPTFLGGRVYIDFTDGSQFNEKFDELLHKLYDMPVVVKPPLGEKPSFTKPLSEQETPRSEEANTQLPKILEQAESAADAYAAAVEIVRTGDEFGWRQLLKQIKPRVFDSLVQWRQNELDEQKPKSKEQLVRVVDEAVDIISPLISIALVGVEYRRDQFRDQKSVFDDLLNRARWNRAGYTDWWINIPNALGYVYHSLHGSLSLSTNQLELALSLARVKISNLSTTEDRHAWETGDLIGWSGLLRDNGWKYLSEAYKKWEWLGLIFGEELEYRISLVAYYMALNIHELASRIASGQQDELEASLSPISPFYFTVLPAFLLEEYDINQQATSLLRNQEELAKLWTCLNVTREQMESSWETWLDLAEKELWKMAGTPFYRMDNPIYRMDNPSLDIFRNFFEGL